MRNCFAVGWALLCSGGVILAIESSCDESALAVFDPAVGMRGEWIHSQVALHQEYGGVVPDLASRQHLQHFPALLEWALAEVSGEEISQVAVTTGPGLAACLAMGLTLGKSLSLAWGRPLVGVNHLRGHVFSPFMALHEQDPAGFEEAWRDCLPHLALLVSGGNTVLLAVEEDGSLSILAQTVDDAAGEALDKGAKLLGLPYPGGPLLEKRAAGGRVDAYDFPRSFTGKDDWKFSFSGLKTSLRYRLEKMDDGAVEAAFADLAASYQEAVVQALVHKAGQALRARSYRSVGLSGGVSNNKALRGAMATLCEERQLPLFLAQPKHTGDNAGMIAFAAWMDAAYVQAEAGLALGVSPAWGLL